MHSRAKIYVAGPYSKGDVAVNIARAIQAADNLANLGFAPFVPHLTHFWHICYHRPYEFWLWLDKEFLLCCEGLLRLPGESSGADSEVELANKVGIPVFACIADVDKHFSKSRGEQ